MPPPNKFETIEEAIKRANETNYGLAAGVCSNDIARAMGIAKCLRAGTVWINNYGDSDIGLPFGGYKESGWGRDKGEYALENYMEVKTISFPINHRSLFLTIFMNFLSWKSDF